MPLDLQQRLDQELRRLRELGLPAQVGAITVADVERLLVEAGAKRPWKRPELLTGAAGLIESAANQLRMHKSYQEEFAIYAECREAVTRLSKAVARLNAITRPDTEKRRADAERRSRLVRKVEQEFDLSWPSGVGLMVFREALYLSYSQIVGAGSISKKGPATRFVAAALSHAGWCGTGGRPLTAAATEAAMTRTRRERDGHI